MAAGQELTERPAATVAPAVLAAFLVGRPLDSYLYPADALERVAAVLRTAYGGGPELPHFAAMRRAESTISATLRARRALDEPTRPLAPPADCAPPVPDWADGGDGGARVPIVVGPRPQPPAPVSLAWPDRGSDF